MLQNIISPTTTPATETEGQQIDDVKPAAEERSLNRQRKKSNVQRSPSRKSKEKAIQNIDKYRQSDSVEDDNMQDSLSPEQFAEQCIQYPPLSYPTTSTAMYAKKSKPTNVEATSERPRLFQPNSEKALPKHTYAYVTSEPARRFQLNSEKALNVKKKKRSKSETTPSGLAGIPTINRTSDEYASPQNQAKPPPETYLPGLVGIPTLNNPFDEYASFQGQTKRSQPKLPLKKPPPETYLPGLVGIPSKNTPSDEYASLSSQTNPPAKKRKTDHPPHNFIDDTHVRTPDANAQQVDASNASIADSRIMDVEYIGQSYTGHSTNVVTIKTEPEKRAKISKINERKMVDPGDNTSPQEESSEEGGNSDEEQDDNEA